MKQTKLFTFFLFIVGFITGIFLQLLINRNLLINGNYSRVDFKNSTTKIKSHVQEKTPLNLFNTPKVFYEQKLAEKLFDEIKIFCWVFTHSPNHKTKVPAVRRTWGRRCNKLIFMSNEADPDQPDIIKLPVEDGRGHLWNKTKLTMKYVHDKYLNDYDWFMRADDDK
jgi:hypothetical protein